MATLNLQLVPATGKDTFVNVATGTNYGNSTSEILLGIYTPTSSKYIDYFDGFDISSIISTGAIINSATFSVYKFTANAAAFNAAVYAVLEAWGELTITGLNQPACEGVPYGEKSVVTTANVWVDFDVKTLIQRFADGEIVNYGFQLRQTIDSGNYCRLRPCENVTYPEQAAKLTIDYTIVITLTPSVLILNININTIEVDILNPVDIYANVLVLNLNINTISISLDRFERYSFTALAKTKDFTVESKTKDFIVTAKNKNFEVI